VAAAAEADFPAADFLAGACPVVDLAAACPVVDLEVGCQVVDLEVGCQVVRGAQVAIEEAVAALILPIC
jgi:hypothetical protein